MASPRRCGGAPSVTRLLRWSSKLGARFAVGIGTINFTDPYICPKLIDQLPGRMKELGIESLEQLIKDVREARRG